MSAWDCIVCGGPRFNDDRGIPFCETCQPVMARHVVSNQTAPGKAVAVCPCGWSFSAPWSSNGRAARDAAVQQHWRDQLMAGQP